MPNSILKSSTIVSQRRQAAKLLGVTERQLGTWFNEPWFPPDGRTKVGWDVAAIRKARDAMGLKGSETSEKARQIKLARDAEALKQAQIITRERTLKLQERERSLLSRRGWELFAAELLTGLSDWCDQLPALIAADFPKRHSAKIKRRIKAELDRKRLELRDELARKAREMDEGSNGQG